MLKASMKVWRWAVVAFGLQIFVQRRAMYQSRVYGAQSHLQKMMMYKKLIEWK